MRLSARGEGFTTSATMAFAGRAAELRRQGRDIVSLAAGEPYYDTPEHVVAALERAVRDGATRYPPLLGVMALREAVARHGAARYAIAIDPARVVVTPGAKMALWCAFQLLVDPGDEVLVPSPCWVSYEAQIAHAGGRMIAVPMAPEEGFRLDVERLRAALTPRSVGIVLNLPNNPTGAMASHETMQRLADLVSERDLWIVSDDIYAELRFDAGPYPSPLGGRPELLERCVIVDGPSKSHAMTGWRLGYAIAPEPLIPRFGALLGQTVTGVTTFVQHAAVAAIEGDKSFLAEWVASYRRRSERVVQAIRELGLPVTRPEGAFYAFVDVRPVLTRSDGALDNDAAFVMRLLEEEGLATVPGTPFHAPGWVRLSYACSDEMLADGLERLARFVTRI